MAKFTVGQEVHYYHKPGDVRHSTISSAEAKGFYRMDDNGVLWDEADLFATADEAFAGLSGAGRRMAGCLREARNICEDYIGNPEVPTVLGIALKLFDAGS